MGQSIIATLIEKVLDVDCQRVNKLVEMLELLKNEDVPTLENTKDDQEKEGKKKKGKRKGKKKRKKGE